MEHRRYSLIDVNRTKLVVTSLILCLVLCNLNVPNGLQFAYSFMQRGLPKRERPVEEPGSNLNEIIEGPGPFSRAGDSGIEERDRGQNWSG